MTNTFIIAEAGVNHNADIELAYALVDAAFNAGADAVKFQAAVPELVTTAAAPKASYQDKNTEPGTSQLEMIKQLHFPLDEYKQIKRYCDETGIMFFATAFDLVSLEFVDNLGQLYHKVPSGEITNLPYLRKMGACGKPVILSTGMATLGEIGSAIDVLLQSGVPRDHLTVLHCNTEYPTPMADVNLLAMLTIRDTFGVSVGYSDHTAGIEVAIAAVALGARVIEKHLTTDRKLPGPDHEASLEPDEFTAMVNAIRNVERSLGQADKRPSASEIRNLPIVRKSLIAAYDIKKGETFSDRNLTVKRPGTGISPMLWDEIIGKKASRDFAADEIIVL